MPREKELYPDTLERVRRRADELYPDKLVYTQKEASVILGVSTKPCLAEALKIILRRSSSQNAFRNHFNFSLKCGII